MDDEPGRLFKRLHGEAWRALDDGAGRGVDLGAGANA